MALAGIAPFFEPPSGAEELHLDHLRVRLAAPIMTVTLTNPPANALSKPMFEAVERMFELAEDEAVRVVVVTGAGDAFSIGADISGLLDEDAALEQSRKSHRQLERIEQLAKPVIAAINGHCLGGGLELALACHLRIASSRAKLGLPEVSLGLLPGMGGMHRLPRLVGRARAHEMILTGRTVKAEEALQMGLVNSVVAPADVLPAAERLARRIAAKSPAAVRAVMRCLFVGRDAESADVEQVEMESFDELSQTPEVQATLHALARTLG